MAAQTDRFSRVSEADTRADERRSRGLRPHRGGFTLVEILIVVIILGILSALVLPKFTSASTDSKASAAASTCHSVQQKILEYRSMNGSYPTAIDPEWFVGKSLPRSPFQPDVADSVEIDVTSTAAIRHPRFKFINASVKPYWYNVSNGTFRARVAMQSSTAKTLALYNKANGSNVTTYFGQTD